MLFSELRCVAIVTLGCLNRLRCVSCVGFSASVELILSDLCDTLALG